MVLITGKENLAKLLKTTRQKIHRLNTLGILPSVRNEDGEHTFNLEECLVAFKEHQRTASKFYPKGVEEDENGVLVTSFRKLQGGKADAN